MKYFLSGLLISIAFAGLGQSVSSINFKYLYNPQSEIQMIIRPVSERDSFRVFYRIKSTLTGQFLIQWSRNESYNQRQGGVFVSNDTVHLVNQEAEGFLMAVKPEKPWLLVAKLTHTESGKSWVFAHQIEKHYPVNGYLEKNGKKVWDNYISASSTYKVRGSGSGRTLHFSYYKENFPTPSPPFASKELKMDRFLFPDSIFKIEPGNTIGPFTKEGLYLAQEDTVSSEGFSFLVKKEPYPKYNKLADLKGPLLFVTTQEENDAIGQAGEDKAKFDKVILEITGDKERARVFMRNYFKRVETANQLFTSFKEGWKTDKGMIYVVFGLPDEVQLSGQQESWTYKSFGLQFFFNKTGSVYAPDHYVLIRDKQYTQMWYQTIDLWRKSRF